MPRFNSSSTPLDPGARITAERVAMALRTRFDPLPSLNPQRLVQYLQQFEHGYLDLAARTWEAMERRDDRLASVSAKAKSALARYGFEVRVRPNLPPALREQAARHQAALEYLYTHCTVTNAVREDESGGFSLLVRQMADAIGKRYSVHEIVWEPGADGSLTATFRHAPLWFFEATTGRLRYKQQDGAALGVQMDPDAWLVTVGDGIMEACSVLWVYKHLPLRDWLAYSEKFGLPYLLGKTQAIFNSAEWQAMVEALRGFGSDGAAVVGGADDIVPVAVGGGSEATPFPGLVERSERAMSILWRGADLGTQAHSGSGQGQGASLQGDETSALDEDRAGWLSESLGRVSRTAIKYLFGEGVQPLAYVRLKTQVAQDIQLDLAMDAFLLSNGAPVGVADVLARYGRPTPTPGEPLLQPPGGAGSGGAKGAASEDATLASIERAANRLAAAANGEPLPPGAHWVTIHGRHVLIDGEGEPRTASAHDQDGASPEQRLAKAATAPRDQRGRFVMLDGAAALQSEDDQKAATSAAFQRWLAQRHQPAPARPSLLDEANQQQLQMLGEVARGFLEDGLLDTLENLPKALLGMTGPVQLYRLVQLLRQAAANPQGLWAGLKEIERERLQAVLAKLRELTTTPRGVGELLFDIVSIWLGGEAVTAFKESELGVKLAAGLKGKPAPTAFTRSLETREPIPTSVPEAPAQPAEPAAGGTTATSGKATSELSDALSSLGGSPREGEAELYSRTKGKPMDRADYTRIKADFERRPGYFIFDTKDVIPELDRIGRNIEGRVEGWTVYKNIIFLRPGASRSAVFEELIHAAQLERGMDRETQWIQMEIEAKQELIKFQKQYGISDAENAETIQQLKHYTDLQVKQKQR